LVILKKEIEMEAIKIKGVASNGKLTVAVPKQFEEKELEVIILSAEEPMAMDQELTKNREEKAKRMMSIVGAANYPDFPLTKYDVYEQ
jgi:hypothetical protein